MTQNSANQPIRPGILRRGRYLLLAATCCLGPLAAARTALGEEAAPATAVSAPSSGGQAAALPPAADSATPPAPSAPSSSAEVTELWAGSIFSSTYRVGVCFSATGAVRGVVHLRLRNGQVDVYHINGSVKDNVVKARHSSGHSFQGRLVAADRVEGVIHLKNGLRLDVEGRRVQGAPLTGEDCAPPDAD